ncbi:MAG TPA: S41 family peptidase [Clostridia bacterium]|nr:S41 family peptidase [Clostridia bacterium]
MKSWLRTLIYFVAAILITAFVTAALTVNAMNAKREDEVVLTAEDYSKLSDLLVFNELIDKINNNYYYDPPARDELIGAALSGMVNSLGDEYARYFTAEEYEKYLSNINGQYSGIGLLVGQPTENGAPILDVYDDTPAAQGGVLAGDIIAAVDGASIVGLELSDVAAAIDREVGESVTLTLLRGTATLDVTLVCSEINIQHVSHKLFKERTGYIKITMFTGNCAEEFKEAVNDLADRGMKCLVIDLRDNPGGSLSDVISIADTLLGECTVVSVRGRLEADGEVYTSNRKGVNVPIAVIVNENSASASEILAAAIQENGAGVVVGMTTFGKGIVQTTFHLSTNGGWIKLTTDGYYTPQGNSIHGKGVVPNIEVDLPDDLKDIPLDEISQEDDAQLWAALDYVRGVVNGATD